MTDQEQERTINDLRQPSIYTTNASKLDANWLSLNVKDLYWTFSSRYTPLQTQGLHFAWWKKRKRQNPKEETPFATSLRAEH